MGSFSSKKRRNSFETPQSTPTVVKRIEDPRSPTDEISRTPIEVAADRFQRALKGNNDFSPLCRGKDSEPGKKLRSNFEAKFAKVMEKENNQPNNK